MYWNECTEMEWSPRNNGKKGKGGKNGGWGRKKKSGVEQWYKVGVQALGMHTYLLIYTWAQTISGRIHKKLVTVSQLGTMVEERSAFPYTTKRCLWNFLYKSVFESIG